jgi:thiol-disulfide isomerase/thioredoxin
MRSIPIVKLKNFILAGGIVCFCTTFVFGAPSKALDLSGIKWVTQNAPSSEDMSGHVCVIEFWATWCPPCREQIPHMKSLAKEYEDRNVIFVGISEDRSIDDVRKFVEKKKINYNIAMDNGLSDRLGVNGIPTLFVISHEGKILWNGHPGDSRVERTLDSAVSAAPKPILAGVDMGRFSHLRIRLCGGRNFARAYSEIEACAKVCDCSEKICACRIFGIVNEKLRAKITAAQEARQSDPKTAMLMYKEIMDNYGGISMTKQVEQIYLELQRETAKKTDKKAVAKAEGTTL